MINHPNRSKNRDAFKDALGEEAYGVFGRTGFTPSQLAEYWKRDLGLYDEVIAQRGELIAALKALLFAQQHLIGQFDSDDIAAVDAARAAIRKVEGR